MTQFKVSSPAELGSLIKAVRKSKHMSQMDVYDRCNVNDHTISRIETTGLCNLTSLFAIFEALDMHMTVDVDYKWNHDLM